MPEEAPTKSGERDTPRRIEPGDVLAGKYRVQNVLGEGGMGTVLEATHTELDQKVAIKCLLPHMVKSEEAVSRFMREAKVLAMLQSEHVTRVFDVGKLDSGLPYMVMEFLDGCDLGAYVRKRGALPLHEAAEFALQACAGLAEVHAAGIVHRDLKPSNCYVVQRADGTACLKLLDFGISKFQGDALTRTAAIMGSPGYMSPEQMASTKDVDERADIWALGATLYEMLTARPAFIAENAPMLCIKIANEEPDSPKKARAEIPDALEAIVMTCLKKEPSERYADVGELAEALSEFSSGRAGSLVEKIDGVLRGRRSAPRSARSTPTAGSAHDRATVRATPATPKKRDSSPKKARLSSDATLPARRASRGRGRMVIFVMGSFLGAGVAAAYFGDVQKIRAQIVDAVQPFGPNASGSTNGSTNNGPNMGPNASPNPRSISPSNPTQTPIPSPTLPPPPSATSSPGPDSGTAAAAGEILDAAVDALDDDAGDDDDDEEAGTAAIADAAPTAKPAAPHKRKPRPTRPTPKRPRRR